MDLEEGDRMIYKIDFKEEINFNEVFEKMRSIGDFCFSGIDILINTNKDIKVIDFIKEYKEINSENYKSLTSSTLQKWCKDILTKVELEKYEKSTECQEKLREINKALNTLEKGVLDIGKKETVTSAKNATEDTTIIENSGS